MKNYKLLLAGYTAAKQTFTPLQLDLDALRGQARALLGRVREYAQMLNRDGKAIDNVLALAIADEGVSENMREALKALRVKIVAASAKAAAAAVEVQKLKAGLEDGLKKDIQDYVTQAALDHDALVNQHAQSLLPLCENMEEATFVVGECSKIKQMREAIYRPERAYSLEGKIKALLARSINE